MESTKYEDKMPLEILGFTVKPEITIGDIAAIGALILSPLIFYFGYSQTRKSEQIRIARELADRINAKMQKLKGIQLDEARTQNGVEIDRRVSEQKTTEVLNAIHDLSSELEYFYYLLYIHEIRDGHIITYYLPVAIDGLKVPTGYLEDLRARGLSIPTL